MEHAALRCCSEHQRLSEAAGKGQAGGPAPLCPLQAGQWAAQRPPCRQHLSNTGPCERNSLRKGREDPHQPNPNGWRAGHDRGVRQPHPAEKRKAWVSFASGAEVQREGGGRDESYNCPATAGPEEKCLIFRKCHFWCLYPIFVSDHTHTKGCPRRVTEFSENPTSFSRTNNRH